MKNKLAKVITKKVPNRTYASSKAMEDEDEDFEPKCKQLGYFQRVSQVSEIVIYIDEDFGEPSKYRNVCNAVANTGPEDIIKFEIASYGGRLDGLTSLLSAIAKTEAITEATINGPCKSAGAFLALSCNNVYVTPYADFMIHYITFGSQGKASDVMAHVKHTTNYTEGLFKDTFKYFMTDDEIELALQGKEFHMKADEIIERMKVKMKILEEIQAEEGESDEELED